MSESPASASACDDVPSPRRTILCHASRDALGSNTELMLSRLGYQMLTPENFFALRTERPGLEAELLVVDERRLDEVDASGGVAGSSPPIVLLTGREGVVHDDPRVVGAVKRPAGLHDLYRLMQQVFEDAPRSTPRVSTELRAVCHSGGAEWEGSVLSLSENGCLIHSPEAIPLGQKVQLALDLPSSGTIALEAEATYVLLPYTGLVWSGIEASSREALGRFVEQTILA